MCSPGRAAPVGEIALRLPAIRLKTELLGWARCGFSLHFNPENGDFGPCGSPDPVSSPIAVACHRRVEQIGICPGTTRATGGGVHQDQITR